MIKYILFDLDGTLTDSQEGLFKSIQYALSHYGIKEENTENLKRFIGPPIHYALCEFYGFPPKKQTRQRSFSGKGFRLRVFMKTSSMTVSLIC